jgi:hypothetical protein
LFLGIVIIYNPKKDAMEAISDRAGRISGIVHDFKYKRDE